MMNKLRNYLRIMGIDFAIVLFLLACSVTFPLTTFTTVPVANSLLQGLLQQEYFSDGWEVLDTSGDVFNYEPSDDNDYLSKIAWVTFGATKDNHVFTIKHYLYCFEKTIQNDTVEEIIENDVTFPITNKLLVNLPYSSNYQCVSDSTGDLTSIGCYISTTHYEQRILSLLQIGVSPADMSKMDIEKTLNSIYSSLLERVSNINSCD